MSHTKGPWRIEVHNKITVIESQDLTITNDISPENATLVAVAPEMLETLEDLSVEINKDKPNLNYCFQIIIAMIDKARGESE